jgi:Ca2+-binding RTX toxin-like protein
MGVLAMVYRYIGFDWAETISGGSDYTIYYMAGGDDSVLAAGNNCILHGEAGNDTLSAGANSSLYGGDGNDVILLGNGVSILEARGDAGDDYIEARGTYNSLFGGDGNDTILGGGSALLRGGDGDDLMRARGNNVRMFGDGGNDTIALQGSGTIAGGSGNDSITSNGFAEIDGGAGDDAILAWQQVSLIVDRAGDGSDTIQLRQGGLLTVFASDTPDNDRYVNKAADPVIAELELSFFTTAVAIDLKTGQASGAELGNDTIMGFNRFTLGLGDDTVSGSSSRNETIDAYAGNDFVNGRGGKDWIDGGRGNDTICGSAGDDRLFGGFGSNSGDDLLRGGDGNDYLIAGSPEDGGDGSDQLFGGAGNDSLRDGLGNDSMYGGDGNDILSHFTGGNDQLFGGAGADMFVANVSDATSDMADIMDFEDGTDKIRLGSGPASFYLSSAAQVGDDVEIGCFRIHNFTLAQLDLSDFF